MVQIINHYFLLAPLMIFVIIIENSNSLNFFTQSDDETEKGLEEIRMIYFKRSPQNEVLSKRYLLNDAAQLIKDINSTKPLVIYIHGFSEDMKSGSVKAMTSAYLQRNADNIVVLDWSSLSFGNYLVVSPRANKIAEVTATAIKNLVSAGLNVETLHVIGHSMGAQIAGFLGKFLDFKIPRVTGLDPANPLFYQFDAEHVDEKSGQQVDIIHTDGGYYGASPVTGSVDFYPNGGSRPQPGCGFIAIPLSDEDFCSHHRSWRFWAESVTDNEAFPALKCDSYEDFNSGRCNGNHIVYYGYGMPKQLSGKYYFQTNDESPFGKGMNGIKLR